MGEIMTDKLKLTAKDNDDLMALSSLLQDATVLIGDMGYDSETQQFMLVAARFIKNPPDNKDKDKEKGRRRLMGVNISGVMNSKRQGFSPKNSDDVLNLLAIQAKDTNIDLVFSGKAMVRLECSAVNVYAADLDEGWSTSFSPKH